MRNKILISAFACDPTMGSEPYVGWNWLIQTLKSSKDMNVILLTRKMHVSNVLNALDNSYKSRLKIIAFDFLGFSEFNHRHKLMKAYYVLWQIRVFFLVLLLQIKERSILLVIHCTYNVVDMPGFLWMIPRSFFLWGPVGGGQTPPKWAKPIYGKYWLKQVARKLLKRIIKYNPLVIFASWRATKILVANEDTLDVLPRFARRKVIKVLETAINEVDVTIKTQVYTGSDINLLWAGQIEPRKSLIILLEALLYIRNSYADVYNNINLKVIGEGPDKWKMIKFVYDSGLGDKVTFTGGVAYQAMQPLFKQADVFIFTSVQDTSGNVLLEALSNGIPSIAFKHQGAKEILQKGGGILIEADSYDEAVKELGENIMFLISNPEEYKIHSSAAIKNIHDHHLWEKKGEIIEEVLNEIFSYTKNV